MDRIGKNVFALIGSRLLSGIIIFFVFRELLPYLGPELYGKYTLVTAYVALFTFVVDLGMQQVVIKRVSEDRGMAAAYLGNFLVNQLVMGFAVALVANIAAHFIYEPLIRQAIFIGSIALFVNALTIPFTAIITAHQRMHFIAGVNFLNTMMNAGLLLLAIYLRQHLFFLMAIGIVIAVVDLIIYAALTGKRFTRPAFALDLGLWKEMYRMMLPFTLLVGFTIIYNRIDVIILRHFTEDTVVGFYTAAYKFLDILAFVPAVVGSSLFPFFSEEMKHAGYDRVRGALTRFSRYMIALALPMGVGMTLLADRIVAFSWSEKFAESVLPLQILIWAMVITFSYAPIANLVYSQKTKGATKIAALAVTLNIVLNVIFIPRFSLYASAVITVLTELVVGLAFLLLAEKLVRFSFFSAWLKPLLAGLVMGLAVWTLRGLPLLVVVGTGGVVYFLGLSILRFWKKEDWQYLKLVLRREEVATSTDVLRN
jgi:O-antigen/teichoic acid export membrane protein